MKNLLRVIFLILSLLQIGIIVWWYHLELPDWAIIGQGLVALGFHLWLLFQKKVDFITRVLAALNAGYLAFSLAGSLLVRISATTEIYFITMCSLVIFVHGIAFAIFDGVEAKKEEDDVLDLDPDLNLDSKPAKKPLYRDEDLV